MKTDNELIAEFMGWKSSMASSLTGTPVLAYHNPDRVDRVFSEVELRFNTSWDWLMPVVEKIELDFGGFIIIHNSKCVINPNNIVASGETKIDAVYKAVVMFLK